MASLSEMKVIHNLIAYYAKDGTVLPVSYTQLWLRRCSFFVAVEKLHWQVIGCISYFSYSSSLKEIRTLIVRPNKQRLGIGTQLLQTMMTYLDEHSDIFVLTRETHFFKKKGFQLISRENIPEKVFKDCHFCPRKDNCDELAMIKYAQKSA